MQFLAFLTSTGFLYGWLPLYVLPALGMLVWNIRVLVLWSKGLNTKRTLRPLSVRCHPFSLREAQPNWQDVLRLAFLALCPAINLIIGYVAAVYLLICSIDAWYETSRLAKVLRRPLHSS